MRLPLLTKAASHRLGLSLVAVALAALSLAALPLLPAEAAEETATAQPEASAPEGSTAELTRKVEILTATRTLTALPENEPGEIDLTLVSVPGAPAELTRGVTARGFTRYVKVEDALIGQLILSEVEKEGKREQLDSAGFVTQFELEKPELDANAEIAIEGDAASLVTALERLASHATEDEEPSPTSSDIGARREATASNAGSNQDAADYTPPEPMDFEAPAPPTVRVTTEGCSIRVDRAQLVAIQQSRVETNDNGTITSSECEDGNERFPLRRSYSVCADRLDIEARTATAQYRLFYEDAGGARVDTGECTPDDDQVFQIVEKTSGCSTLLNGTDGTAVPQSALVYMNASNAEVQVRGCAAADMAPIALERDYAACSDAVDVSSRTTFARYILFYTDVDGSRREAGACQQDPEIAYPIKPDYAACEAAIDIEARSVTARFQLYYTDGEALRREVGECESDLSQVFAIAEDREACSVYIDLASGQAVPRAALVYSNAAGQEIRVRGCAASDETAAVALVQTTDSCTIRHDFDAGMSYRQSRQTYVLDGRTWDAGPCADDGTVYAHVPVRESDAGSLLCEPIVSVAAGQITMQSRVRIVVDDTARYITECTPETQGTALAATTQGCTDPASWTHDLSAGVSYGEQRFYYEWNGMRTYVSECQQGGATYPHHLETTGWQNNDAQLTAWPLSTVYIEGPAGTYTIVSNELLSGTEEIPYSFEGQVTVETGEVWYEGCTEYAGRKLVSNYTRPDETTLAVDSGAALPEDRGDKCTTTTETRTVAQTSTYWVLSDNVRTLYAGPTGSCTSVSSDGSNCPWSNGTTGMSLPGGGIVATSPISYGMSNNAGYTRCLFYTWDNRSGTAQVTLFDQTQKRTVTHYPDGSESYGGWFGEGAPYERVTLTCTRVATPSS